MDTTGSIKAKDISQYLHLYLGCEVQYEYLSPYAEKPKKELRVGRLTKINTNQDCCIQHIDKHGKEIHAFTTSKPHGFNLLLRELSDMTEEEDKECYQIMFSEFQDKVMKKGITHYEGEKIRYLLSKHFDLFNLISEGLAIDKTILINQP